MALLPGITLPKDIIESDGAKRDWLTCIFFAEDPATIGQKKLRYFEKYPPQGYDTHTVGNINKHPDGYYTLKVKRWSTCD